MAAHEGGPDRGLARRRYSQHAATYERSTAAFDAYRRRAVERLGLLPGEVVLDVGCGTGLCFRFLEQAVGLTGRIVGVEQSAEMLARALERVQRCGCGNVTAILSPAEEAEIPVVADAALFCATHDVLRSPDALVNVLSHVRVGGRVVATGGKWASPWLVPLNLAVFAEHRPYVTTFEGFDQPWSHLASLVGDLEVEEVASGAGYLAWGTVTAPPAIRDRATEG